MNTCFRLALGAVVLLIIDANEAIEDNVRALCLLRNETCNPALPPHLTEIVNEDGMVDTNCSTLDDDRQCVDYLRTSCEFLKSDEETSAKLMRLRLKEHLCRNAPAFVRGKACWESEGLFEAVRGCLICSAGPCLEVSFLTVSECSDVDARLMAGIIDRVKPDCITD